MITPSFFKSKACREELQLLLEREAALGRNDFVLPVYYVNCRKLEDSELKSSDQLAQAIAVRQWAD